MAEVGRKVDGDIFASSGNGIIDIFRAAVVPFAQDGPCIIGINQDDESVISLQSIAINRIRAVEFGQGEVEAQVLAQVELRCHKPVSA